MKLSTYALIIITAVLHGCASRAPFSENDSESKNELKEYLNGVVTVSDTLRKLSEKGFECATISRPWVLEHIPAGINKEPTPYLCTINRTTIPFVCADHWSIFIGHKNGNVLSTSISHGEPSCL